MGAALAFLAPLVGETIKLVGQYIDASKEQRAELEARRDKAVAEMRGAARAEAEAHDARTAETRKAIADADAALNDNAQDNPR